VYSKEKERADSSTVFFGEKFNDTFEEKNLNQVRTLFGKTGLIQGTMWQCSLRTEKKPKKGRQQI